MEALKSPTVVFPTSLPPLVLNPVATSILLAAVIAVLILSRKNSKFPHANPPAWYAPTTINQLDAVTNGINIVDDARKRFSDKPYRYINNNGEIIVLPARFVNAIRNEEGLSFAQAVVQVDFANCLYGSKNANYPGLPRSCFRIYSCKSCKSPGTSVAKSC